MSSPAASEIQPYKWHFKELDEHGESISVEKVLSAMEEMCDDEVTVYPTGQRQLELGVWRKDYSHVEGQPYWTTGLIHPHVMKWIQWVAPRNKERIHAWESEFIRHCRWLIRCETKERVQAYYDAIDAYQGTSSVYNDDLIEQHPSVTNIDNAVRQGQRYETRLEKLRREHSELQAQRPPVHEQDKPMKAQFIEEDLAFQRRVREAERGFWWVSQVFGSVERSMTMALTPGMVLFEGRMGYDLDNNTYEGASRETIGVGCLPFWRRRMTSTSKNPRVCMKFMGGLNSEVNIRGTSTRLQCEQQVSRLLHNFETDSSDQELLFVHEIASSKILAFDMSNARYELAKDPNLPEDTHPDRPTAWKLDSEQEIVLQPFIKFHVVDDGQKTGVTVLPKNQSHKVVRQIHTHVYTEKQCPKCHHAGVKRSASDASDGDEEPAAKRAHTSSSTGTGNRPTAAEDQPGETEEITEARKRLRHLIEHHYDDTDW